MTNRPTPPLAHLALPSSLALLIAGCGGGSGDDPGGPDGAISIADVELFGAVVVSRLRLSGNELTIAGALFNRFTVPADADAEAPAEFQRDLEASAAGPSDTCDVYPSGDDENLTDSGEAFGEAVGAGETITLTSPAGTYATLVPQGEGDDPVYRPQDTDGALPGFAPSGLVADIPGDVFPAFANVAIPDVTPGAATFQPAENSPIDAATEYTWTAADDGATVEIGLETDAFSIDCHARDDGSFTLPAAIVAELGGDVEGVLLGAERQAVAVRQQGNALLLVLSSGGTP